MSLDLDDQWSYMKVHGDEGWEKFPSYLDIVVPFVLDLLEVLQKRNYKFDASILPTYISPLMRTYYFWNSNLTKEERESRKELFGSYKEGFYPIKPFYWKLGNDKKILEIPVTTIPFFKIPFHLSYMLYISGYSKLLMKAYLSFAIFMFKIANRQPSYLLHPLDLISGDKIPQLAFFPGMNIATEKKVEVFKYVLRKIKSNFDLLPMLNFTDEYVKYNERLKEIKPAI